MKILRLVTASDHSSAFGLLALILALATAVLLPPNGRAMTDDEAANIATEAYIYGYPLVVMDVTREVMTATPAPTMDGTAAPINQLAKMPY